MTEPASVFKPLRPDRTGAAARSGAMTQSHDKAYNRDQDQKPGSPPRMAQEPKGGEGSARTPKTATDPVTGEPNEAPPRPNAADGRSHG